MHGEPTQNLDPNFESTANSTTIIPTIGSPFIGEIEDVIDFLGTSYNIFTTQSAPHTGTLFFGYSFDGINFSGVNGFEVSLTYDSIIGLPPQCLRTVAKYFRIRYVPDDNNLTGFRIGTIHHRFSPEILTRFLGQSISDLEPVKIVGAILKGKGTDGDYYNIGASKIDNLKVSFEEIGAKSKKYAIGGDKCIFGASVSMPRINQIQAQFDKSLSNNRIISSVTGTGTTGQGLGLANVSSGVGVTSSAKLQTNKSTRYIPAREVFSCFTAAFTTPTNVNSHQRIGLFDNNNGFFVGYNGTTFGFTIRKGGADTFIPRSSWNGDSLDGGVNSLFTSIDETPQAIDFTKLNIYRIRWGYLGSAVVFLEIMGPNGIWIDAHTVERPNFSNQPTVENPNLPITMEVIKSSSDATDLIMKSGSWAGGITDSPVGAVPSSIHSREHVDATTGAASGDITLYTVNTGRKLQVSTIVVSIFNSSLAVAGRLDLKDGGAAGTLKMSFTTPAATNQANGGNAFAITLPEPLPFLTDLFCDVVTGTLAYSVNIVGYEEEA